MKNDEAVEDVVGSAVPTKSSMQVQNPDRLSRGQEAEGGKGQSLGVISSRSASVDPIDPMSSPGVGNGDEVLDNSRH